MIDYEALIPFARTKRQLEALEALAEHGSQHAAAKVLGTSQKSVWRMLDACQRRAALKQNPSTGLSTGEAHSIKGVSTLYKDGEKVIEWVKTDRDQHDWALATQAAVEAFKEELPKSEPRPASASTIIEADANLLNQFTITDYHLGMLAWGEETGDEDWDTNKAEDLIVRWFELAIDRAPKAVRAVFAQMGDFLHWDGFDAVTPASGHVLDADTRFQRLVRVVIRVIRRIINMLLDSHISVDVLMLDANHDPAAGAWLREFLAAFYEDNPRVNVDTSARTYYALQHGNTMLCYHHGHKRPPKRLDEVFVSNFRRMYGDTEHAYGHCGHLHSDHIVETPLMKVEQHRTLAPNDAYASRGGWMSGRDAKVITYHWEYGEVGRLTISPAMVMDTTQPVR